MTAIQFAEPADAEAISAFAEASFKHTFGHLYDPADLAAFLADWNPPAQLRAQLQLDDVPLGHRPVRALGVLAVATHPSSRLPRRWSLTSLATAAQTRRRRAGPPGLGRGRRRRRRATNYGHL